jgi:isopenicillin N synthase-like dioxygenase
MTLGLPVVDIGPLVTGEGDQVAVAAAIDAACEAHGFFYVVGHGVDPALQARLDRLAREFFAQPDEVKASIAMAQAGRAWRGWFPVGGELTSGRPDRKEGIYFGAELPGDHARVAAGVPLHGANLFPARPAGLRAAVLEHLDEMTRVGHALLASMAVALGLEPGWFDANLTADPTVLFRIFHYPPSDPGDDAWGVGEHTDYGLLTILRQDDTGGLEVKSPSGWIDAPPIPGSFVCNLGDMLERMTGGRYRSTPHRVRNTTGSGRLSFPFFFDPSWDAEIVPTPGAAADPSSRWDGADVHAFRGTYGDYLLGKVAKVFPELKGEVLDR